MVRVKVDPEDPEPDSLTEAAVVIRAGGLVAFPTDTLYGLAVDPFNVEAVARVFLAKGRAAERPLPLIAADEAQIASQLGPLPSLGRALAERFWPGPLTILMTPPARLAAGVAGGTGLVGVRVPAHGVARGLCRAARSVLTATSANPSGRPGPHDPALVATSIGAHVDVLLDGGRTAGGPPSTIVDVTGSLPRLVRPGAISWEAVQACLNFQNRR